MSNFIRKLPQDAELIAGEAAEDRRIQAQIVALKAQQIITAVAEFGSDDGPIDPDSIDLKFARFQFQILDKALAELKKEVADMLAEDSDEVELARAFLARDYDD